MINMKTIMISFIFLSLVLITRAQEKTNYAEPLRVISVWLDAQRDYENIPGISAGIVIDQDLLWSNGFGYSDLGLKVYATDSTIYSICSISKLFTSIAIMQIRDQGKLDLDDGITKHLSWFNLEQAYPESAPVTIRSLLTHSSGLPRESDYPYWTDPTFPFPSREQMKEKLSSQKSLYPASTVFQYSNLAMSLLGEIVSEKSGMPYEKYVTEYILKPLSLKNTCPELPESLRHGQLATGYSVVSREGTRDELAFFQARGIAPAAGYSSNVKDLAKFASWQFETIDNIDDPVLNGNTLKEMQRVQWMNPDWKVSWGLGFHVREFDDLTMIGHSGGCPGYLTQLQLIPKKKWAFIVMVNGLGINTFRYVEGMYNILNSYEKEKTEEKSAELNLDDFSGKYYDFWGGESIIVPWKGKLALFSLNKPNQSKPDIVMKHSGGDIFKSVRDDGEPGHDIRFERDKKGNVIRYWSHSNPVEKIETLK